MPNISPEMMRMASQQLGSMSPEQLENMKKMAQNMGMGGGFGAAQGNGSFQRSNSTPVQSGNQ